MIDPGAVADALIGHESSSVMAEQSLGHGARR